MTTLDRIKFLMQERGWSQGQLAKMAGLPRSTVTNMFRRETEPSLTSLIAIGKAFGLTPMQVLSMGNTMVELTPEQQEFFMDWAALTGEQKQIVAEVVRQFHRTRP